MGFILKDLTESLKNNKWLYALMITSQLIGCLCLMTVYGVYVSYEKKQKQLHTTEKTIEVDFHDVSIGQLRTSLYEMLGEIENDIDYMYVLTGYKDLMINCHFEYHNGQYGMAEQIKKNVAISQGRFFDEKDIASNKKVIVMGGDGACGKKIDIDSQMIEVIGYSGIEFEKNASWMWINHCPENLQADLIIFNFRELPTYDSYMQIKNFFNETFADGASVQEFEVHDEEEMISIRTVIFMSLAIGIVIALNTGLLYGYLIRKRRKDMAVFAIIGASKIRRFRLLYSEIGLISFINLLAGETLFHFVIEKRMNEVYGNSSSCYSLQSYIFLGGIYFACIMFIMLFVVIIMNRTKIKEMLRRVSHD